MTTAPIITTIVVEVAVGCCKGSTAQPERRVSCSLSLEPGLDAGVEYFYVSGQTCLSVAEVISAASETIQQASKRGHAV